MSTKPIDNRFKFFGNVIDEVSKTFPDDLIDYMVNYYKENNIKFRIPSKPEAHNIQNWTDKLYPKERIYNRIPTKKDLLNHFGVVALASIFESNWFCGIDRTGFTETNGPVIVKFVPENKCLECAFISPLFLWTAQLDKSLSYQNLVCSVQNQLIVKDTVEPLVQYSIYNNDFMFGRTEENEYLRVNNAIEYLVETTDLYTPGTVNYNEGLVLITAENQAWFTFTPIWFNFSVKIPNMILYHSRDWLDKYGIM